MHRPTVPELRAALWTVRSVRSARRQLRRAGWEGMTLPHPPEVPLSAGRGVRIVLRRLPATCLERAVVLQRWRAAHGDPREVVIGVSGSRVDFRAHAWLEDEALASEVDGFRELVRLPP